MSKRNVDEVAWREYDEGENAFRRKQLSDAVGADRLGCSLYELDPGDRSWPYHYHTGNEEAIYVLSGSGTIRLDGAERSLEADDYVACPADESGGHQVVNDGDEVLRYLTMSTMNEPDVTVYPEKGTFGVFAGSPPGGDGGERSLAGYFPLDADVDYWEGADGVDDVTDAGGADGVEEG